MEVFAAIAVILGLSVTTEASTSHVMTCDKYPVHALHGKLLKRYNAECGWVGGPYLKTKESSAGKGDKPTRREMPVA